MWLTHNGCHFIIFSPAPGGKEFAPSSILLLPLPPRTKPTRGQLRPVGRVNVELLEVLGHHLLCGRVLGRHLATAWTGKAVSEH